MAQLIATLTGVPQALRKTELLKEALNRVGRAMFGEIGQYMVRSAKKNFSEQRSPDGQAWLPPSERTIKEKGHSRLLFKTGALNRGIQIVSLENEKVSVGVTGTEAKKGITHQFGRERIDNVTFHIPEHKRKSHSRKTKSGKTVRVKAYQVKAHTRTGSLPPIPARPFLGFSEPRRDIERIGNIARKHLRQILSKQQDIVDYAGNKNKEDNK
jgi:phage virion morphogenesis protein